MIRTQSGDLTLEVGPVDGLPSLAAEWMYILRNRSRWAGDEALRTAMQERAGKTLAAIGIDHGALYTLVTTAAQHIEVEFFDPGAGLPDAQALADAASAFPWEFVLGAAARAAGRSQPLLVTRLLAAPKSQAQPSGDLLFVESAPGRLDNIYTFDYERSRLHAALGTSWKRLRSPTRASLASRITSLQPAAIHVSGVDNHQAALLLKDFYEDLRRPDQYPSDGMILRGPEEAEVSVGCDELATALTASPVRPVLITLNLYYSANRIARACVRHGAAAAIGFLDEVPDDLAEYFFQSFYTEWRLAGRTVDALPKAFGDAWTQLRERGLPLFGTGIVLWLASTAFGPSSMRPRMVQEEVEEAPGGRLPTEPELAATRRLPINQVLQVQVDVPDEVNYSLLHNSRRFLDALTLTKMVEHPLDAVQVEVQLNAGDGSLPYRHTEVLLDQPQRTLADEVTISLTAGLLRSPRERVQTTLYVRVTWDGRVAHEDTSSVALLPVDEWFDDTEKNPWLPSFVLPRDPAIARIITAARRHLVTLQDDATASFDGYQSTDARTDDCESVDQQVQALWTTLAQDFRVAYINPPPAYSRSNQRLRTPSEVIGSSSGTCIDLALLLASCLEYIDIYPVIVLLTGHAFTGYWRCDRYHHDFCTLQHLPASKLVEVGPFSKHSVVSLVDPYGWRLARQQHAEILEHLRLGRIRFLEATGLCFNYSYAEAVEEGRRNLGAPQELDSLLDIILARRATPPVTPLPMILTDRET